MLANGIETEQICERKERTAKTRANPRIRDLLLELSQIVVDRRRGSQGEGKGRGNRRRGDW
jgi:hypothetical protein